MAHTKHDAKMSDIRRVDLLLADDDLDDRDLFEMAVKDLNLEVDLTMVSNGEQLLNQLNLKKSPPDILFLDLNMPRINGFECLKEIKQSERLRNIPVIIYSTSIGEHAANQLYEDGAFLYVQKPDKFSKLKDIIHEVLRMTMSRKEDRLFRNQFILTL
jgi:CheY-like chemotaxis protein